MRNFFKRLLNFLMILLSVLSILVVTNDHLMTGSEKLGQSLLILGCLWIVIGGVNYVAFGTFRLWNRENKDE